jgi:hypothetical protein
MNYDGEIDLVELAKAILEAHGGSLTPGRPDRVNQQGQLGTRLNGESAP